MLVTEKEAQQKTCIFKKPAIVSIINVTDRNRAILEGGYNCEGSACMAWRWGHKVVDGKLTDEKSDKGFCGMSGSNGAP